MLDPEWWTTSRALQVPWRAAQPQRHKRPPELADACWACLGDEGGAGPLDPVVHVRQAHILQRPESVLHTLQGRDWDQASDLAELCAGCYMCRLLSAGNPKVAALSEHIPPRAMTESSVYMRLLTHQAIHTYILNDRLLQ